MASALRRISLPLVVFLLWAPAAGAWTWPVAGSVVQGFSFDPAHPYAGGQHRGIDIAAATGAPVVAPVSGVVSFAGTVPSSGKSVTLETAGGLSVTLTHLGSIAVARNASVAEGAAVGRSARAARPRWTGHTSIWACGRPPTRRAISTRSGSCLRSRRLRRLRPRRRLRRLLHPSSRPPCRRRSFQPRRWIRLLRSFRLRLSSRHHRSSRRRSPSSRRQWRRRSPNRPPPRRPSSSRLPLRHRWLNHPWPRRRSRTLRLPSPRPCRSSRLRPLRHRRRRIR